MGDFIAASADSYRSPRKPGVAVDRIVIHTMEGTFAGTTSWFAKAGHGPSSAHFLISRTGQVRQMVRLFDAAWHAGSKTERGWNDRSVGIELEAWTGHQSPPSSIPFPRDDFPLPMLNSLAALIRTELLPRFPLLQPNRQHIIGHSEVPGATHTDPGITFPWKCLLELLS